MNKRVIHIVTKKRCGHVGVAAGPGNFSKEVGKSINSMRSLPRVFEKVSRPPKCHSNFFYTHTHIYVQVKKKAFKISAKIEDVGLNED